MNGTLVLDFVMQFAALECALKRTGRLDGGHSGGPRVDWPRFADEIGPLLNVRPESKRYLMTYPPDKQRCKGGKLVWVKSTRHDTTEAGYLLDLVRTIRNNLFHGGKYPDGPVDGSERNDDLLRAGLDVIDPCRLGDKMLADVWPDIGR